MTVVGKRAKDGRRSVGTITENRIGVNQGEEWPLDVVLEKNYDGGYVLNARWGSQLASLFHFDESDLPSWITGEATVGWDVAGEGETETADKDDPLMLLRLYGRTLDVQSRDEGV